MADYRFVLKCCLVLTTLSSTLGFLPSNHKLAHLGHKQQMQQLISLKGANGYNNDYDNFDDDYLPPSRRRVPRGRGSGGMGRPPPPEDPEDDDNWWNPVNLIPRDIRKGVSQFVLAAVFLGGLGAGVTLDSALNTGINTVASREVIDRRAPSPEICQKYGSSAIVMDQRIFMTLNPFSFYVSQSEAQPGCVLNNANVNELLVRQRKLLTPSELEECKVSMNTWGFSGDLDDKPRLSCLFESMEDQNGFKTTQPKDGYTRSDPKAWPQSNQNNQEQPGTRWPESNKIN
uniref:Uncharacterized protein n=1 Tax=Fibrocapsa japonica TaxID=94617 RepID=A0A7S2UZ49_9STRA|mmetsp:Transcript_17506/g.25552  ORF Transcript_17506/g.25552 Transcript_17506/m.25552 type:complete len:287 (+) Transcript_17506:132-992(+)